MPSGTLIKSAFRMVTYTLIIPSGTQRSNRLIINPSTLASTMEKTSSLIRTFIVSKLNMKLALHSSRPDLSQQTFAFVSSMEQHTCLIGLLKRQKSLIILESAMAHRHRKTTSLLRKGCHYTLKSRHFIPGIMSGF